MSGLVCDELVFNSGLDFLLQNKTHLHFIAHCYSSAFNRDSFLQSIQPYINKYVPVESRVGGSHHPPSSIIFIQMNSIADLCITGIAEKLRPKSRVLYFPVNDSASVGTTSDSNSASAVTSESSVSSTAVRPLRILWNHRWEFDKNPDLFFETLLRMKEKKLKFELSVLGEHYIEKPDIFQKAQEQLREHIVHWGYLEVTHLISWHIPL